MGITGACQTAKAKQPSGCKANRLIPGRLNDSPTPGLGTEFRWNSQKKLTLGKRTPEYGPKESKPNGLELMAVKDATMGAQ
jgi:hypothetical protein